MALKNQNIETKEKKDAVQGDKSDKAVSKVAKVFAGLSPEERVKAYAELREAINHDNDLLSQGKEPGTEKYDELA